MCYNMHVEYLWQFMRPYTFEFSFRNTTICITAIVTYYILVDFKYCCIDTLKMAEFHQNCRSKQKAKYIRCVFLILYKWTVGMVYIPLLYAAEKQAVTHKSLRTATVGVD